MEFLDGIQILTRLGLTIRQARVYLALVQSGISSVKEISKVSDVPREDLYRILSALQKLSLVEKGITVPVTFKAVPVHDALSILHERRINETSELQVKMKNFLEEFEENFVMMTNYKEESQFVLIPEKETIAKKRRNVVETAQTSIDVVTSWSRYSEIMFTYVDEMKKALKRGVRIRHITEKPEDEKSLAQVREIKQIFKKYPSFEVNYFRAPITTVVALVDKKEVLMFISPTRGMNESPALWSTNPCLIELSQHYFEMMWLTALEEIPEER